MKYWLLKTEPSTYSWEDFVRDKQTAWTGVRNFQARNFLRAMRVGDRALIYHSGEEKRIVGLAEIIRASYPDPTAQEGDWSAVDIKVVAPATKPFTLADAKNCATLKDMVLVRNTRLSVQPVTAAEGKECLKRAGLGG